MATLSINDFLSAGPDLERAQYSILAGLRSIKEDFGRTAIYPHLAELIDLHGNLRDLLERLGDIRSNIRTDIEGIDLEKQEIVRSQPAPNTGSLGTLSDLVEWAIPRLREAIEEGRTIFDFVDASLEIEQVGIVPAYTEEGYLMVPDAEADELCVLRYALSLVTRASERYRGLRTTLVKRLPDRKAVPPQHIKLELTREQPDLPNPATYYVRSDIGFPFDATVMPVAKRKLMRHLFVGGSA